MSAKKGPGRLVLAAAAMLACSGAACEGELGLPRGRLDLEAPRRAGFEGVSDALQPHCGTLDCHGQFTRNLRLYGGRGLRLEGDATPAEGETTPAEYDANYWSTISLEPETLSQVVASGGAQPERTILIRKARGTTRHKGGTLMKPGDDLDRCLVAWLAGNDASEACFTASRWGAPEAP